MVKISYFQLFLVALTFILIPNLSPLNYNFSAYIVLTLMFISDLKKTNLN